MNYNVKEASKKIGMSTHNIRYYTNMELVPSLKHDKNGNRIFDDVSLNWLICIRFLRESGMALADIRHYFALCSVGDSTISERYEILQNLMKQSEEELKKAQRRTDCIRAKVAHCQNILAGNEPDDCNPINWPTLE